jgi:hypothetical protein
LNLLPPITITIREKLNIKSGDHTQVGILKAKLRRAQFVPTDATAETAQFGASPDMDDPDALAIARRRLQIDTTLESEYDLSSATVMVYKRPEDIGLNL